MTRVTPPRVGMNLVTWRISNLQFPSAHGGHNKVASAPATKSAHGGSQSAVLARNTLRTGVVLQSAAPATKSAAMEVHKVAAPATKVCHFKKQVENSNRPMDGQILRVLKLYSENDPRPSQQPVVPQML